MRRPYFNVRPLDVCTAPEKRNPGTLSRAAPSCLLPPSLMAPRPLFLFTKGQRLQPRSYVSNVYFSHVQVHRLQ